MRTKLLLSTFGAIAVIGAVAGCAAVTYRINPHAGCDAGSHVCNVDIAVNTCKLHDMRSITATPENRHIPPGTWVIRSRLVTPGFQFAEDGIELKTNPGGIFTKRGKTGANEFQWVDNNRTPGGPYEYSVHILKADGSECASYDPDYSND